MGTISWLHLSDWNHKYPISGDRKKKKKGLLKDIEKITNSLGAVDFILFSGDITNSGAKEEFDEVKTELIDPIQKQLGTTIPIYCVPGNHDIQRGEIGLIASHLRDEIASLTSAAAWRKFNDTVSEPSTATELNKPLSNYFDFLDGLGCRLSPIETAQRADDRKARHQGRSDVYQHRLELGSIQSSTRRARPGSQTLAVGLRFAPHHRSAIAKHCGGAWRRGSRHSDDASSATLDR